MEKMTIFYLIVFLILNFSIFIKSAEFDTSDYELYGPTLAANDQFIISIQKRIGILFSAIYQYSTSSPRYCTLTYTPPVGVELYATMLAVGRNGLASLTNNKFAFVAYANSTLYFIVASIDFSLCQLTPLSTRTVFNTTYPSYSVLGINDNGTMVLYITNNNVYVQKFSPSASLMTNWTSIGISASTVLVPAGIYLRDSWGILGVYTRINTPSSKFRATAYLIKFTNCFTVLNSICIQLTNPWQISYYATWHSTYAPQAYFETDDYDPLYAISISINNQGFVLFGVQSVNIVYRLSATSSSLSYTYSYRFPTTTVGMGFGKCVGWIENTTAAILFNNFTLGYTQWLSSVIELYPITASSSLSNTISAYASYPNTRQQLWSLLNPRIISMQAVPETSSLIYMDYFGLVHVILPSPNGYFAYTIDGIGVDNNTIYIAPTIICPSGTIKNLTAYGKDLFRYCVLCPEGTFYAANRSNSTNQCISCDPVKDFCPWGAVTSLPVSALEIISQTQVYPQSPENDGFEDILLINMFNVDFPTHCLLKQPLFYGLIIIGLGFLILLFMGILKLTGKLKKQRRMIKSIFKQTDLIGEGELWIGGVASLAIMVLSVFAYRFSSDFLHQYPIETATDATFACDPSLRNSKFSTSMQSLGTPLLDEEQPLFDMLNQQLFTLNVAFINTDFTEKYLNVSQVLGSILVDLPRKTTVQNGILMVSTNLTSHSTTIQFNITRTSAVGALRIGLSGPSMEDNNYYVQELNFSYVFNYTNRTLTQDPVVTIQLIKLINETQPLSGSDETQYSALWIPTFIKNDDQLFYTENDFRLYHVKSSTILTVQITEATYYIYNQQEPITKLTEIIFTDILFTTMCIELFALTFLFFKLAILPIIKAIMKLCFGSKKVTPTTGSGRDCPYCRSVDADALPTYQIPVQRALGDTPAYPIKRQSSDIAKLHAL